MDSSKKFFFIGIGGSGMSGIAKLLKAQGHYIAGSDRENDQGQRRQFYQSLHNLGIKMFAQDGSGITPDIDIVVSSAAVETKIPDMIKAREYDIPIRHRAEQLHEIMSKYQSIAIAGTSGKSTVSAMISWIFKESEWDPTVVIGAQIPGFGCDGIDAEFRYGQSEWSIFEADESDGSIINFSPSFTVLHNISVDHKQLDELEFLFKKIAKKTKKTLLFNADCHRTARIAKCFPRTVGYSIHQRSKYKVDNYIRHAWSSEFRINSLVIPIHLPGDFNIQNALAAFALCVEVGIAPQTIKNALATFPGIRRRFEKVGTKHGITVVDDFAHNPDKIKASLSTAQSISHRIIAIYQPHGFGPTRFHFNRFIELFSTKLRSQDILIILPIFYAGGTVNKSVSSEDLVLQISNQHPHVHFAKRDNLVNKIRRISQSGDLLLLMGARDPSLKILAKSLITMI